MDPERRKRVNRIKNGIVWTIAIWMIFSLLAIIILSVQVYKLGQRLSFLEDAQQTVVTPSGDGETEKDTEAEDSSKENREDLFAQVTTGIDTPENLAGEGDVREVYLTFNCEPGSNTNAILDILARYQVKASFFVVGSEEEADKAIYKRIVDEGHTLGMHSYSNQYSLIYSSTEEFIQDFEKLSDYLFEVTGVRSRFYRFPGGSGNQISDVNMVKFAYELNQRQITYFDWNVSAGDTTWGYTKEEVVANVLNGVSGYKTSVVLLHDGDNKSATVEALGSLIEALQAQGMLVQPIDEDTKVIQYIHADSIEKIK